MPVAIMSYFTCRSGFCRSCWGRPKPDPPASGCHRNALAVEACCVVYMPQQLAAAIRCLAVAM